MQGFSLKVRMFNIYDSLYSNYSKFYYRVKGDSLTDFKVSPIFDVGFYYIPFSEFAECIRDEFFDMNYTKSFGDFLPTRNVSIIVQNGPNKPTSMNVSLSPKLSRFALHIDNMWGTLHTNEVYRECCNVALCYICRAIDSKNTMVGSENVISKKRSGKEIIIPITHMCNKKYIKRYNNPTGNKIEWKHSWKVLGHWRKNRSLGKNREGLYCENGRTWVKPCVKGNGDLIEKLRILPKFRA